MNTFSAFDTGVMVALLLGIEFLRSDIQTILYCKRDDPGIFKSCLYTLFIFLVIAGLYRKILPLVLLGYAMVYVIGVLIPLLGYVVSMMNYFASTG